MEHLPEFSACPVLAGKVSQCPLCPPPQGGCPQSIKAVKLEDLPLLHHQPCHGAALVFSQGVYQHAVAVPKMQMTAIHCTQSIVLSSCQTCICRSLIPVQAYSNLHSGRNALACRLPVMSMSCKLARTDCLSRPPATCKFPTYGTVPQLHTVRRVGTPGPHSLAGGDCDPVAHGHPHVMTAKGLQVNMQCPCAKAAASMAELMVSLGSFSTGSLGLLSEDSSLPSSHKCIEVQLDFSLQHAQTGSSVRCQVSAHGTRLLS